MVIVRLIGFNWIIVCNKCGNVLVGIKVLDKKVSIKIMIIDRLLIRVVFLIIKLIKVKIYESDYLINIVSSKMLINISGLIIGC